MLAGSSPKPCTQAATGCAGEGGRWRAALGRVRRTWERGEAGLVQHPCRPLLAGSSVLWVGSGRAPSQHSHARWGQSLQGQLLDSWQSPTRTVGEKEQHCPVTLTSINAESQRRRSTRRTAQQAPWGVSVTWLPRDLCSSCSAAWSWGAPCCAKQWNAPSRPGLLEESTCPLVVSVPSCHPDVGDDELPPRPSREGTMAMCRRAAARQLPPVHLVS